MDGIVVGELLVFTRGGGMHGGEAGPGDRGGSVDEMAESGLTESFRQQLSWSAFITATARADLTPRCNRGWSCKES